MRLQDLFRDIVNIDESWKSTSVQGVYQDARQVVPQSLFIAIPGTKVDGHQFVPDAINNGAQVLVVERDLKWSSFKGLTLVVSDSRKVLDILAARINNNPSLSLRCFGITGTNGKTSTSYMIEHLLNCENLPTGVIGTINHHLLNHEWNSEMTTPDPLNLQKRLKQFLDLGAKAVAMEISSHALDQKRADSVEFDAAIFTNLTRDHLDYHQTMDAYFTAKARLFSDLLEHADKKRKVAVVNTDDEWGRKIPTSSAYVLKGFGYKESSEYRIQIKSVSFTHTEFEILNDGKVYSFDLPMLGEHNVLNMVGATLACEHFGINWASLQQSVQTFKGVPGRLQWVQNKLKRAVYVDYAHTPDALENVLRAIASVRKSLQSDVKIWTVFGCGGDRDKGKRPLMAAMAEKYSDYVVVTSDNPRTEDPESIIREIFTGFSSHKNESILIESDRRKAIQTALESAAASDVILIAGKGHENYQIIGDSKIDFSDYETAASFL